MVDGYDPLPSDTAKERHDKERTGEAFRTLPDWIRQGKMLTNQKATVGSTVTLQHGLKRKPQGWILVRPRISGAVGSSGNDRIVLEVSCDAGSITLQALGGGGMIVFDLWIW